MKFLIHSQEGAANGLAYKLVEAGAEVLLYLNDKKTRSSLKGMVPQVSSLGEGLKKIDRTKDIILFDMVGSGKLADTLKLTGYNVLFGSSFADKMELDRKHGVSLAENAGIKVPEYKEFSDTATAIDFFKKNDGKWVIKPDANVSTSLTMVVKDAEQGIAHLKWVKDKALYREGEKFVIQRFVDGVEVSTELWFQNGNPIYPANGTIETKKFLAGDLGPSTGCQTSMVWNYAEKEPRILGQTLKKMLILFKAAKYTGPIDINSIVSYTDQKAYFLEFTSRLGYNAIYAYMNLLNIPIDELLTEMAFGNLEEMPVDKEAFAYAMRVTIPPYPNKGSELADGRLIKLPSFEWIYPSDMRMEGDDYYTAGQDGQIMDIACEGDTMAEAEGMVIETFNQVEVLDKQARTQDGCRRARADYEWLKLNKFINSGGRKEEAHAQVLAGPSPTVAPSYS